MSVYVNVDTDSDTLKEEKQFCTISSRINKEGEPPTATMEAEKRIRREIANSNERRRMQSINNGFQSLRSLLPHHEGEKLSKAAILQQTAEYIYSLEQEKTRLLSQNCQLKRLVNQHESGGGGELPPKKRKTEIIVPVTQTSVTTELSDDGLGSLSPEPVAIIGVSMTESELREKLEKERYLRRILEEQVRQFESQQKTTTLYQVEEVEDDVQTLQLVTAENLPPIGHTQTVVCSPQHSRSPSPESQQEKVQQQQPPPPPPPPTQRLPSVLEAAIKAEPKVEVERLPSPSATLDEASSVVAITVTAATTTTNSSSSTTQPSRIYVSNTSRQNLETIVEAIRHLEGDHLFGDEPQTKTQQVPLALTTKNTTIKTEMNTFLDFRAQPSSIQQQQQSRPGVIVVKQAS